MAAAVLIKFPGGTPPCDIVGTGAHACHRAIYLDDPPSSFDFRLLARDGASRSPRPLARAPSNARAFHSPRSGPWDRRARRTRFRKRGGRGRESISRGCRVDGRHANPADCARAARLRSISAVSQPPCANTPYAAARNVSASLGCHAPVSSASPHPKLCAKHMWNRNLSA